MPLQIESSELKKRAPQILTKFALKLGFLTKRNYFEIQQLYHLVAKDWKETIQILQALLSPPQWKLLQNVFQEWLFVEVAHKNKLLSKPQGEYCIQKQMEYIKQNNPQTKLVLEEEKILTTKEILEIQKKLQDFEMLIQNIEPSEKKEDIISINEVEFGRYEILKELGQGGMGKVYQAYDVELKRTVALKVLLNLEKHTNSKRFLREAQLMGKLNHPNIVKIYDVGEWKEGKQNTLYFTMEWIDGSPLDDLIEKKRLTLHQSAEILRKIAVAISCAHRQGIIHRDIKPSNIVVDTTGEPWLMDFGLAKIVKGEEKISQTGSVLGTPVYMSPEQAAGKIHEINEWSDIYSLGALFYEMITGLPPFRGDSTLAIILQVVHGEPPAPRKVNANVPANLENICMKAMDKVPQRRYPSGEALAEDLQRFLRGIPVEAAPPSLLDFLWRKIQRNKILMGVICVLVMTIMTLVFYWSYKEYRLLKELQDCMKLVLGLQQIATKNPEHRGQLVQEYIRAFSVHVDNNDRNAAAYLGRGFCYIMMGDYQKGYDDLTETIELEEYSPLPIHQLYLLRADCSIEYGHYRAALADVKKAQVPDGKLRLGKIFADLGKYNQAIQIFDEIILQPDQKGYSWESFILANALKAEILSKQGKKQQALYHAHQAIEHLPHLGGSSFISVTASSVFTIQGIVFTNNENYREAEKNFHIALQWLSSNEAAYSHIGKMYARHADKFSRQSKEYKTLLKQAWENHEFTLNKFPNSRIAHYNVACYYAIQKDYARALKHLDHALDKGFKDFTSLYLDPDLKALHNTPQLKKLIKKYDNYQDLIIE